MPGALEGIRILDITNYIAGPLRVAAVGRPGGRGDQDRDPRQGGPVPHLGQGAQELQPELLRPQPQQEEPDPGHEDARGQGGVPAAGPGRGCHRREPPSRGGGPSGHRLRRRARDEPAHHLLFHLRLRPGRSVPEAARLRHHRPVPERAAERPHRAGPSARPGRGLLRSSRRDLRLLRRAGGAGRPGTHRRRPEGGDLAPGVHHLLPGARHDAVSLQRGGAQHAEPHQDRRRLRAGGRRRQAVRHPPFASAQVLDRRHRGHGPTGFPRPTNAPRTAPPGHRTTTSSPRPSARWCSRRPGTTGWRSCKPRTSPAPPSTTSPRCSRTRRSSSWTG